MSAQTLTGTAPATTHHAVLAPGAEELAALAPIERAQVRPYTVGKRPGVTLICVAFDAGTILSEHIAKGPILIQTVTGDVEVEVGGAKIHLPLGSVVHVDARVSHSVRAITRARILVTLLQGEQSGEPAIPGVMRGEESAAAPVKEIPLTDVSGQSSQATAGEHASEHAGHSGCNCGEADEGLPELDVRTIPHAIRHATVFGALQGLRPGGAMILTAHHNPVPLLRQVEDMFAGAIEVTYREEGPEVWKLLMARTR